MNSKLYEIERQFLEGSIKQQDLEQIIFKEIYEEECGCVQEACRDAAAVRCGAIEKKVGIALSSIKASNVDNISLTGDNTILTGIEMKVGGAVIPMGIAGPVCINGQYADGEFYIPLATNEAALIAGVQRGIKAINLAGGIKTLVHFDGMTRAPLIEAPDIYAGAKLCREIEEEQHEYVQDLGRFSQDPFVRLYKITTYQLGVKIFIRLLFKTGDAMGMNGVTKASAEITKELLRRLPEWKLITISSNLCTDKKAAHINVLNGRGKSVETEVFISDEILSKVFKKGVHSRSVEKVVFHKCYLGSCLSGTLSGFNVNAANALAAFFAATGQDLAQVITSASCFIQADAMEGGLRFTASMPSLEVATIGGGTMFGTAREALDLIGCAGYGKDVDDNAHVMRLAEIAATAVTALDLNTACAQAAGYEMADSHVRLARGEKA